MESSGAPGASSGSMQSSVDSSSDKLIRANLRVRHSKQTEADILQVFPRREGNICAVPKAYATERGRTAGRKQAAALGAEGVLVKTGGDESREVVTGGKLVVRA